jgi:hypothetical protein
VNASRSAHRCERRAVLEVRADGADDHRRPRFGGEAANVRKVALEVAVNMLEIRAAVGNLFVEKHLHAAPLGRHVGDGQDT